MTVLTSAVGFVLATFMLVQAATPPAQRFDYQVRADFFAGVAGDEARLQKAMDLCERTLAGNPKHPEALVWHGASLLVKSGRAFGAGDMAQGGALWSRGLKEMDDAVSLAPDNVGVLIPRSATLLEATRTMPEAVARPLVQSAVAAYERVLSLQTPYFATLGDHAKGELLFGLADGYYRLGDATKARMYFERIMNDAPGSGQTKAAREWLSTGTLAPSAGPRCSGCHQ
jgi:hypothetical protein